MSIYTPDETTLRNLSDEIEATPPRPHHSALLEIANRIRPGCTFRYALNRGGWYRPGGVIAADGTRIAASLETWAKDELKACGGDMHELAERHTDSGLLVTRHSGRTHYFVAAYGPAPADFLQLEVEELQEVLDRELIAADMPPDDMQELLEPLEPSALDAQAVGAPRYRFRRMIDMRQTIARVMLADGRKAGLPRLLGEWLRCANTRTVIAIRCSPLHWSRAARANSSRSSGTASVPGWRCSRSCRPSTAPPVIRPPGISTWSPAPSLRPRSPMPSRAIWKPGSAICRIPRRRC
jgi:hypothetical protein